MMKWLLLLFLPFWGFAQNGDAFVTTFSSQHGLPPLKIFEMAKDSAGYLWIGSNLGLHRFDGKSFKTFNNLPNSVIPDIQVRSDGKVFIAIADHGLAVYNEYTEDFDFYEEPAFFENLDGFDFNIAFGADLKVFVSLSGYGLLAFDLEKGEFKSLIKKPFIRNILTLHSDPNRLILAGDSIFIYDILSDRISLLSAYNPLHMALDLEDNLWINEESIYGYLKINTKNGEETIYADKRENATYFMHFVDGEIWSDAKHEIIKFNIETSKWDYFRTGTSEITGIYAENNGRIWFGQDNKLNVIDPQNQFFNKVPGTEGYNYVSAAKIGPKQIAFLSFSSDELHLLDLESNKIEVSKTFNADKELKFPFSMVEIQNELWVSFSKGIGRYRISDGHFEKVKFSKYKDYFDKNNKLRLFTDDDNNLWINSLSEPVLFRVNIKTMDIDSIHYKVIGQAFEDGLRVNSDGEIKLPSDNGIISIDFDSKTQKNLPYYINGKQTDLGFIDAFLEDGDDIWVVTNSSTYKGKEVKDSINIQVELKSGQIFNYSDNLDIVNGLGNTKIILTTAGIKLINEEANQFHFWGIDEGLTSMDRRTKFMQSDQYLFFMSRGIFFVDQNKLSAQKQIPSVFISSFKVNEINTKETILKPEQNDIKIKFESIDLTKPLDVQYKYRLSSDNPWITEDYYGNEIYFLDLKPGKYRFEVSAKHKYSEWSDSIFRDFEINNPIWKKWWFIGSMILLSSSLIYLYYRRQLRKAEEISQMKSRMVELENEALRAQMNPHFIFNSLNSIKSYIIDHEKEDAADYLTNFSDLIRLILTNSRERFIPIEKELAALKLYMDIENIRLEQKFSYKIVNEIPDTYIQPLTLQPFIENAIWHGFIHKKGHGNLLIDIKQRNDNVIIKIEDDGVGRKKSQLIEKNHQRKRSFGILITKERLSGSEIKNNIEIEDLVDTEGNGIGTRVTVIIPYQKSKS